MDWLDMGLLLIVLGMLFIAIGILSATQPSGRVEGAAVLFIGPIPVVLATSRRAAIVGLLTALIVAAAVILWLRQ